LKLMANTILMKIGSENYKSRYFKAEYRGRTHSWSRYLWVLLMLPIGLIVSLAIFYLLVFSGVSFFPGEFLIILTIVMVVVAVIRILYWRSRRRYWPGQW
jgi:high-affinity Fe2+/Pb2+ permease